MNNKILGIILIVIGVALAAWGFSVYDSAGSEITRALSGDAPLESWFGMVVGAILIVLGIFKVK